MAPRREKPAQPPSIQTDVAPRRTTRGKSGTSGNPPATGTSEPTQHTTSRSRATTSQQEPRGFAPMAAMGSSRNLNLSNLPPVLETTPARQAMNRLVTQMSAQAAMASPGPRLHAPGAGSDGDSEPDGDAEISDSDPVTFPVRRIPARRPDPLAQDDGDDEEIVISLNSDDENTVGFPAKIDVKFSEVLIEVVVICLAVDRTKDPTLRGRDPKLKVKATESGSE
ncbi:hypothetical protein C8J57DRAFT_1249146 [Mycena rebaudengoi]|nr:hypothetical protein C8J57DRAFT_1249146 [Mycena rebaudengoi]